MTKLAPALFLGLASVVLAQDRLTEVNAKIADYERTHPRKYVAGQIAEVMRAPGGSLRYVLCPRQEGRCDRYDQWVIVDHPEKDMRRNTEGAGGIGTTPDGKSYYGYGWFQKRIPDAVFLGGVSVPADLYDTIPPPEIAKLYEERAPLLEAAKAKQEATQRAEELEKIKTAETRTIKIQITKIDGNGEHGLMLYVIPDNKSDLRNIDPKCPRCDPAIYVPVSLVPKLDPNYASWRRLEPGLGRVDGPAVNGQVPGATATVDVFPCVVRNTTETKTCVADIRDVQPNKNRYKN